MKKHLGISVYPEIVGKEKTLKYIDLAHKYGFTRMFANLLELENNDEGRAKLEMLSSVYKYARDKGFEVIVDVNPNFYKAFKLPKNEINFFHKLNVSGIRLDEDFKGDIEAELTNNKLGLKVELNASASTKIIDMTLEKGGNPKNLIACHNFYPMRFTGLDEKRFIELSSHFRSKGIRVKAFITLPEKQESYGPWKVNQGMPTLEGHRDLSLKDQVIEFLSYDFIDDILLSQQGATEEQLKLISETLKEIEKLELKTIEIRVDFIADDKRIEKDILFNNKGKLHKNRPDYGSFFIRSTFPRIYYKDEDVKDYKSGAELKLGDVVILNEKLGRYKGEMHIITKEFKDYNNARNLVGKVVKEDIWKLKFIKPDLGFKVIKNG